MRPVNYSATVSNMSRLPPAPEQYRVTRFVPSDEPGSCLGRDAHPGEVFYRATIFVYGCIESGIGLTEKPGVPPVFEFPPDAVTPI